MSRPFNAPSSRLMWQFGSTWEREGICLPEKKKEKKRLRRPLLVWKKEGEEDKKRLRRPAGLGRSKERRARRG